jgi:serine/threonine protein kinase
MLTGSRFSYPPLYDGVLEGTDYLGISSEAMDLLKQMLRLDPNNRLTLRQICAHPWVTCEQHLES